MLSAKEEQMEEENKDSRLFKVRAYMYMYINLMVNYLFIYLFIIIIIRYFNGVIGLLVIIHCIVLATYKSYAANDLKEYNKNLVSHTH